MASIDLSSVLPKLKGWTGQQYGAQGEATWDEVAGAIGTDINSLRQANTWTDIASGKKVDLGWLSQNMAGRLQQPGTEIKNITNAESEAYRQNAIAQFEESSRVANSQTAGPWIMRDGKQVPNPAYTGPAVTSYQEPKATPPPPLSIPQTVPSSALNTGITKSGIIQQAQSAVPKSTLPVLNLTQNLGPGSTGQQVSDLQKYLVMNDAGPAAKALAGAFSRGTAYGYYGDLTKAAVAEWQQKQQMDVQKGQEGYFGPRSREQYTKTLSAVQNATSTATDATTAIAQGNEEAKKNGLPEMEFRGDVSKLDVSDVNSMFGYFFQSMMDKQAKVASAQQELDAMMTSAQARASGLEGKAIPMSFIGGQLSALKDYVTTKVAPYQDTVNALSRELQMDKDMITTMIAYGEYMNKTNTPDIISNSKGIYRINKDGTVDEIKSFPADPNTTNPLMPTTATRTEIQQRMLTNYDVQGAASGALSQLGNFKDLGPYKDLIEKGKPFVGGERDPKYVDLKASIATAINKYRHALYGASLTGFELTAAEEFMPAWGKDDYLTVKTKLENLDKETRRANEIYMSILSQGFVPQNTLFTPPATQATQSNSAIDTDFDAILNETSNSSASSVFGFGGFLDSIVRGFNTTSSQ